MNPPVPKDPAQVADEHALVRADMTKGGEAEETLCTERAHLELLTAVTVAVNEGASLERILETAVEAVCALTGWPVGHALRVEEGQLATAAAWAAGSGALGPLRRALDGRDLEGDDAAARTVRTRQPVWADDLTSESAGEAWHAAGARAVGAWPVVSSEAVVAVLEFGAHEPAPLPAGCTDVLSSVAVQLANAFDRAQTLERLRARERQLREAGEVAGLGSWRWDLADGTVSWSEQIFRMLGRQPDSVEPSYEWFVAHVHADDREAVYAALAALLDTGQRQRIELRLHCADARLRTVQLGAEVAAYEGGRPRELVGYLQDITDRAEAQAALARSEQRIRLILQTATDAYVAYGRDLAVTEWNPAAEALLGWPRDEAVGRPLDELLIPAGEPGERLRRLLTSPESPALDRAVETAAQRRDGSVVPVEVTIPRTPDDALRSAFIRDIRERKRVEAVLHEANATLRASLAGLERRSEEMTILNELIDRLQGATERVEAYRVIAHYAARLFRGTAGTVFATGEGRGGEDAFTAVASWGQHEALDERLAETDCWALRRLRLHHAEPGREPQYCPHARYEPTATLCIPLVVQGEPAAVVHMRAVDAAAGASSDRDLLASDFAKRMGLALANMQLRERLRAQSIRDPLTGLYNRRYLEETFARELARARRHDRPLGVALLDLDNFKRYNDYYGHQHGDQALTAVAQHLQEGVRTDDVVCRYGGEEFVVLFPNATLEQVRQRCEELRRSLSTLVLAPDAPWDTSVSIGVAARPDHGDDATRLLEAADAALYAAKRAGRDRVVVATHL